MDFQKINWITKNGCRTAVIIFLALSLLLAGGCGHRADADMETALPEEATEQSETRTEQGKEEQNKEEQSTVFVYVCGCVNAPGVYELDGGARIVQAVEAAGGMTEQAAASYLNQAQKVEDGLQIYVPSREEVQSGGNLPATADGGKISDGKISLNSATKEELMTLTGIGESKADSILRYRQEHGSFSSVEEIMNVEGIKEGVFNKIKEEITL